ncbi:hypothetical protein ACIBCM_30140 [Streptomyces sp. NPDC051018]|uniref:hypothetical protein n=1 Tax=Streptomyces sp. NPDC051018 TaxID=3365639 RepID=UPI00379F2CD1
MQRRLHGGSRTGRLLAALAGAFLMLLTLGTTESGAAPQGFTAEALAAGLTQGEATALQAEVDRRRAELGGTQITPNVVDLGNRVTLRVAIPGERHPRDLSGGRAAASPHCGVWGADHRYFCAFSGPDFSGSEIAMYTCANYSIPGSWGAGSWHNNQTRGTTSRMYNSRNQVIFITDPAPDWDTRGNWRPVAKVRNC